MGDWQKSLAALARPGALLALVAILGILAASASGGTLAYFTSTAASTGNTFSAGTLVLRLTDSDETAQATVTATITSPANQKPGQTVTAPLTLLSQGTLPLDYGITYTAADTGTQPGGAASALTQFLTLAIRAQGSGSGGAANCTDAKFGDTSVWQESVLSAAALTASGGTLVAAGSRALGVSSSEVLCFQIAFANGAAGVENAGMGGTSTLALAVLGQQQ